MQRHLVNIAMHPYARMSLGWYSAVYSKKIAPALEWLAVLFYGPIKSHYQVHVMGLHSAAPYSYHTVQRKRQARNLDVALHPT